MQSKTKAKIILQQLQNQLQTVYEGQEAFSMAHILMEELFGLSKTQIATDPSLNTSTEQINRLKEITRRILKQEPLQYVLGKAPFLGHDLSVGPGVLIPRSETEELALLIIQENKTLNAKAQLRILDIGTGSGCIPISLALALDKAEVYASDISATALALAQTNAGKHGCPIHFFQHDILNQPLPVGNLDIIVSNPPYVLEKEKVLMQANVLDHEPHQALFVPDEQPLLFYERIGQAAQAHLKKGGKLYFEINENYGKEIADMMNHQGFHTVRVVRDIHGRERIVTGVHP